MKYNLRFYDGGGNAVVMTDMDGKEVVIDCDKVEVQILFDETKDAEILASYVSITRRSGGLQDYVDV